MSCLYVGGGEGVYIQNITLKTFPRSLVKSEDDNPCSTSLLIDIPSSRLEHFNTQTIGAKVSLKLLLLFYYFNYLIFYYFHYHIIIISLSYYYHIIIISLSYHYNYNHNHNIIVGSTQLSSLSITCVQLVKNG